MKRMMSAHFTILMLLFNDSYSLYRMTDSFTLFNDINVFSDDGTLTSSTSSADKAVVRLNSAFDALAAQLTALRSKSVQLATANQAAQTQNALLETKLRDVALEKKGYLFFFFTLCK